MTPRLHDLTVVEHVRVEVNAKRCSRGSFSLFACDRNILAGSARRSSLLPSLTNNATRRARREVKRRARTAMMRRPDQHNDWIPPRRLQRIYRMHGISVWRKGIRRRRGQFRSQTFRTAAALSTYSSQVPEAGAPFATGLFTSSAIVFRRSIDW